MTIHIDSFTAFFIIGILGFIAIILGISIVIVCKKLSTIHHQLEDTNRLLYFNLKDSMVTQSQTRECMEELEEIRTHVYDLSSILNIKVRQDLEKEQRKRYPKPDEVSQIMDTIRDLISIEAIKRKNQKVPTAGATFDITDRVIQTYPEIAPDYIMDKCITMLESYIS